MSDEMNLPEKKVSTFIIEMRTYVDEHGRTVDEKQPMIGEPPKDFVRFSARASLKMTFEFGTADKKFEVPLPYATTVKEAFAQISEEYPAAMKKAAEEGKQEVMAKIAEKTGQAAIAEAPANILNAQGELRGMKSTSASRRKKRRQHH